MTTDLNIVHPETETGDRDWKAEAREQQAAAAKAEYALHELEAQHEHLHTHFRTLSTITFAIEMLEGNLGHAMRHAPRRVFTYVETDEVKAMKEVSDLLKSLSEKYRTFRKWDDADDHETRRREAKYDVERAIRVLRPVRKENWATHSFTSLWSILDMLDPADSREEELEREVKRLRFMR